MQIAILPMPPVTGSSIDRRQNLSIDEILKSVGPISNYSTHSPKILLGSHITRAPSKLYKVFHVGKDNEWIFETVCAIEGDRHVCLYTKMIKDYVDIAISMQSILRYREKGNVLYPLLDIVSKEYWRHSSSFGEHAIHSLIPPIFSRSSLDRTIMQLVDIIESGKGDKAGWQLRPIYDNEPAILEALISGYFIRPPFHELQLHHPDIQIEPDRWFCVDKVRHQGYVSLGHTHINAPEFDPIALYLMAMRPSSLSLTALLNHAVDGLLDLSVTRHFSDPYLRFSPLTTDSMMSVKGSLSKILYESVMLYCQIYDIDYSSFLENKNDQSSISIEKNIYDEVSISIHDLVNDRYICFYSYLPPLLLATMGVGAYDVER